MRSKKTFAAAWAATVWCVVGSAARASGACDGPISRDNVAACAVAASPAVRREHQGVAALEGRRRAVSPLLPSNPELAVSGARRRAADLRATNWYATVSQEVEVAGQRGARRREASAATNAQRQVVVATERDVAAEAWHAYFEALAARDALAATERLEQAFGRGTQAAQAGAARGLVAGVDAQVAELTLLRLTQARIEANRRLQTAHAVLASLLGRDPASPVQVDGDLEPLASANTVRLDGRDDVVDQRAEVLQAKQETEAAGHGLSALRRSRVPNLTFSFTAQRDGFDERVLGGGVALPVPLPSPVGRTFAGEIAEQQARTHQAEAVFDVTRREARVELVSALRAYESATAQSALFTPERVADAQRTLESIAGEIAAARLSISDAIVAQQALIEFVRAQVATKLELCLSSVVLARAAGLPLAGGAR